MARSFELWLAQRAKRDHGSGVSMAIRNQIAAQARVLVTRPAPGCRDADSTLILATPAAMRLSDCAHSRNYRVRDNVGARVSVCSVSCVPMNGTTGRNDEYALAFPDGSVLLARPRNGGIGAT
ncbi:hypothetical protein [Burkholderia sp. 8Y]|uniref:hypothetical protein n=1 Tax=Burkholderia sp. 8Y TaxID=2653133 RepID=UPI00135B0A26|nr:hypothetical protein [Burkholderia sp. 8Y]